MNFNKKRDTNVKPIDQLDKQQADEKIRVLRENVSLPRLSLFTHTAHRRRAGESTEKLKHRVPLLSLPASLDERDIEAAKPIL